jgi:hypothetical protein
LATQLNNEDQFIFYSNSAKETQRVNAGISLNVIASNLPGVLKATTNASLAVANAAVAQAAASAAQADATTAIGDAAGAQASADGKNKIFYQTTAPTNPISGYSLRENDIWYDIDNGYKMAKWSGSAWTEYQLDDQALAGLNVGKLTAGFISSKIIELSDSTAYIQSSSYIQTWVSGMPCSVYNESLQYNGKETPSHNVRCKVKQANGTYKVFNCLNVAGSTNAPAASGNNTWWAEIAVPTVAVDVDGDSVNIPNFGFRVVGQGTAEFSAATFTGNIQSNTGFFGSGKNIVKIGSSGLTIGNSGYIKSDGITYAATAFSGNGFFLGNTQGEGQENAYQFYIGNAATSKFLRWDGTNLIINGRIATGSILGGGSSTSTVNSGGGIIIGDTIGIRRDVDNNVLTITGGTDNWATSGAGQIDLVGKNTTGGIAGVVQLIGGSVSTGHIYLRTGAAVGTPVLTAHYNGSVGINDSEPSSSNGIKLDVNGSLHIRSGVIYSTYTGYSGYTVALNDGTNNVRFQYNSSVGLYAKINTDDPVLIVSPKLNLSAAKILAPFTFDQAGGVAGGVKAGTITWDSSGTLTGGSGVAITAYGIVGAKSGSPKFTINIDGDATFGGALSAPTGNFGGWTIGNTNISGGNITIDSSANNGYIATGQTAYNTGTGFWVGSVSGTAKLSVGNSAGNYLTWDGSSLTVNGSINVTGGNASTQTYAQGVATSAANSAQSAAASDATAKANAAQAVAIGAAASDATTKANAAQATSIQAASIDATLKANTAYSNAKAIADSVAQGTYSGGTLISGGSIFSPVVAGVNGYFSQTFKVGNNGITLDGVNKSIYIGAGTYANANTGFYVDSNAYFSLKDKLYWNPDTSTLTVQGNIVSSSIDSNSSVGGRNAGTIAGAINSSGIITSAALSSKLDTAAGTILGQFALQGSGALQIGTYTNGSSGDIRITPNGITARNSSGATTFSLDGTTGAAVFKGDVTGASGTFAGALSASSGTIGGFNIDSTRLYTSNISLNTSAKQLSISEGGTALLEVVNSRARFAAKNNGGAYTAIFQGDDGVFGGSFLELNNSSGSLKIGFYGQSGFGYFSTFYDIDDSAYYCNPASTSNFNSLNVGGYAVLTTNSGALTAGASTNFGQLQVNDWLTFDNSQTRLSISDDFGNGNYLTYAGGTNGHRWVNSGNSVQLADLDNSGNLSASSHPTYSSRRFKQNIRPIENALNTLKQLNGKIFDWKTKNVTNDIGFIAEEVNEVLPTLVNFDQDGQTKSLDYSRITALLTEAVKEQSGTISNLVAVIADLESRLKKLETN